MVEYKDRLQLALDENRRSARDLAERLGISYQAVKKVLDGKSATLNAVNHAEAAKYLGVRSDWLALGEEPMRPRGLEPDRQWPFPSIDEERVNRLSHDDKIRLDAALLWAAIRLEIDVEAKRQGAAQLGLDVKK